MSTFFDVIFLTNTSFRLLFWFSLPSFLFPSLSVSESSIFSLLLVYCLIYAFIFTVSSYTFILCSAKGKQLPCLSISNREEGEGDTTA